MADKYWQGGAAAVANEWRATPANVEVGDVFTLTCAGVSVSFTATAATVANVTAGLTAAWNASTHPAHEEVTAVDDTTWVTLTADDAGNPVVIAGSATNGGATDDQTLTVAEQTAATGPNHIDEPENWSGGSLPVDDDVIYIQTGTPEIYYGSLSTVDPSALYIEEGVTIGLPDWHVDPDDVTSGYVEYRDTHIPIGSASPGAYYIDQPAMCFLDVGTTQPVVYCKSISSEVTDGAAVQITGSGSGIEIHLESGRFWTDKATTVANIGRQNNTVGTTTVAELEGSNATVTCYQGDAYTASPSTKLVVSGEDARVHFTGGAACPLGVAANGGEIVMENAAPIHVLVSDFTALHILPGSTLTCAEPNLSCAVDTLHLYKTCEVYDPHGVLDCTNDIELEQCTLADITFRSAADQNFDYNQYAGA